MLARRPNQPERTATVAGEAAAAVAVVVAVWVAVAAEALSGVRVATAASAAPIISKAALRLRVNTQIPSCRKPKCAYAVPATVVPGGRRARAPDSQPGPSPVQEVCRNSSGILTAGARRQNPNLAVA
jgi:hypothetical protein